MTVEHHPLEPFLPENARVLMLGSFPPPRKRWCMDFFYPNFQNDMWRIMGLIFFRDKLHFVDSEAKTFRKERIVAFLQERGIALYDTASTVCRKQDNASDAFLEVVEPTDVDLLLRHLPHCRTVAVTGEKATATLCDVYGVARPAIGCYATFETLGRPMRLYRLPSSSRAYPMAIDKKAEVYCAMFGELGMLG